MDKWRRRYKNICEICKKEFFPFRRSTRFCSNKCKWEVQKHYFTTKGKKRNQEAIEKTRKALIGHPIYKSKERSEKISKALKGKKRGFFTEEHRRNLSEARRGIKNYAWKGGISNLKKLIRRTLEYRLWREKVFIRDRYICQLCFIKGGYLEADHINPLWKIRKENSIKTLEDALNCKEMWDIKNGRTLCRLCHRKTETWGWKKNYVRTT